MHTMRAIFLDIEGTGLDPTIHAPLSVAFKIIDLSSGQEIDCYQSMVKQSEEVWQKRDLVSMEVNGITREEMEQGQDKEVIQQQIIAKFTEAKVKRGKTVYICQNPAFDRTFFSQIIDVHVQEEFHWPYHWLDFASMYWALQIKECQKQNKVPSELLVSKNAIAKHYHLPEEPKPHTALNGVNHLILCYQTVIGFGP